MERLGRELGITSGALSDFPSRTAMLNEAALRAVMLLETTFPVVRPASARAAAPVPRSRAPGSRRSTAASPQLVFSEQFGKALPAQGARAVLRPIVLRTRDFLAGALRGSRRMRESAATFRAEELALIVIGAIVARALLAALVENGVGNKPQPDAEAAVGQPRETAETPCRSFGSSLEEGIKE